MSLSRPRAGAARSVAFPSDLNWFRVYGPLLDAGRADRRATSPRRAASSAASDSRPWLPGVDVPAAVLVTAGDRSVPRASSAS